MRSLTHTHDHYIHESSPSQMKRVGVLRWCVHVIVVGCIVCGGPDASAQVALADEFADHVKYIDAQPLREVGRAAKMLAYQELLEANPSHPGRAAVMLRIASLMENSIPDLGLEPDTQAAVEWLRHAAAAAPRGGEEWCDARIMLASRLGENDIGEARALLDEVAEHAPSPVIEVKSLYHLQQVEQDHGDASAGERICRRIQDWRLDRARMPESGFDRGQVYSLVQASAQAQMYNWVYMDMPREEKIQRLEEFAKTYPTDFNENMLKETLKRIESIDNRVIGAPISTAESSSASERSDSSRWLLVGLNIFALCVIVAFVALRRRGRAKSV